MEYSVFYVTGFFLISEFVLVIVTIRRIIKTQTALFYLRNAPLVDRKFNKLIKARDAPIKSSREIATGLKRVRENTAYENKWLKEPEYMKNNHHSFDNHSAVTE